MDEEVLQRLTRIETKLDIYLVDHETRMRSMEKKQWYLSGASAIIAFVATKMSWSFHLG